MTTPDFLNVSPVRLEENQFAADIENTENGDKGVGVLEFTNDGDNRYTFYHIEVPSLFRGMNVAPIIANAAFQHALNNGWRVRVTCGYLNGKFLQGATRKLFQSILA